MSNGADLAVGVRNFGLIIVSPRTISPSMSWMIMFIRAMA